MTRDVESADLQMARIFISCGQFTDPEKSLGRTIAETVRKLTSFEPFFAEEVQDLNGLDANILNALRDCVGLIVVLHPRGDIKRPDGSGHIRASVWIEQEIAIAAYIQRVEKRPLPIIAFIHESVGREGLRDLLHLNPTKFKNESEVIAAIPKLLEPWRTLRVAAIELTAISEPNGFQDGHVIRKLVVVLNNDTSKRITEYDGKVWLPAGILKHWSASYGGLEVPSDNPNKRCFRFSEQYGTINPHEAKRLFSTEYCTKCASSNSSDPVANALVAEAIVDAKAWIDEHEYSVQKTIKQLAIERESR